MSATSLIVVHPDWDGIWPFAADRFHELWRAQGAVDFVRLRTGDGRALGKVVAAPAQIRRLVNLGVPVTAQCVARFTNLREAVFDPPLAAALTPRGVKLYTATSEGFWGQSVAEFALALTLCALRRIPQTHRQILTDPAAWDYSPQPGRRGQQFGDDPNFANGTVAGKRVRVVGAGNIGARYASFVHMLGADVALYDPYASEPSFHRAGARRERYLERLVSDAEIFAPMLPLTEATRGLITAEHLHALPKGCLVVLVTRAGICDMPALRQRVLADELALAADVFDVEPLPLDDPLLGRANVVHTPHNAGRTLHANRAFAEALAEQFAPGGGR